MTPKIVPWSHFMCLDTHVQRERGGIRENFELRNEDNGACHVMYAQQRVEKVQRPQGENSDTFHFISLALAIQLSSQQPDTSA